MPSRLLAISMLGALASASMPSLSHAQLGKLTKKATGAAAAAAGVPANPTNARYVKKIDITAAQIEAVNKGIQATIQVTPETIKKWEKMQEAYDKAMADYEKKKQKYDACVESEKEKAQAKIDAANKRGEQATDKVQKSVDTTTIMAQAQAAQAAAERVRNGTATAADRQAIADFQKTMAGVQSGSNAAMAAMQEGNAISQAVADSIKKKCGDEPQPPSMSGSAGAGRGGKAGNAAPTSAAEEINQQAAAAAQMTEEEYRQIKEKAMGFASSHTEVQGGSETSDDDAKAINQALAQTSSLMSQASSANISLW